MAGPAAERVDPYIFELEKISDGSATRGPVTFDDSESAVTNHKCDCYRFSVRDDTSFHCESGSGGGEMQTVNLEIVNEAEFSGFTCRAAFIYDGDDYQETGPGPKYVTAAADYPDHFKLLFYGRNTSFYLGPVLEDDILRPIDDCCQMTYFNGEIETVFFEPGNYRLTIIEPEAVINH